LRQQAHAVIGAHEPRLHRLTGKPKAVANKSPVAGSGTIGKGKSGPIPRGWPLDG
jgi:hypothetical protein